MRNITHLYRRKQRQQGAVIVIFALALLALMGFAALAVDLGAVYSAKTELQIAADAAAMAAVQELDSGESFAAAAQYAALNRVLDDPITLAQGDVVTGYVDFATGQFTEDGTPANAVRVAARRTQDSPDGPLDLFFARALGLTSASVSAESIAAIDGRVSGVSPPGGPGEYPLLPFAVDIDDVGHVEDINGNTLDAVDFEIDYATGTVTAYESVDLAIQVIGSQITYGAGGPRIPVYGWVSIDNGSTYYQIPDDGDGFYGGEQLVFSGIDNPQLAIKGQALYRQGSHTRFNCTRYSNAATPYVIVLRDGDICPEYQGFDGQDEVTEFLAPYMDPDTREITIGTNDVIFLFEFTSNLNSSAADFQDLVVLASFQKVEMDDVARSDVRFVANVGQTISFYPMQDIDAPGNFGLVSLDGHSNGTSTLRDWIENGYPDTFRIPPDPGYIVLNACPGFHGGIRQAIEARQGDTVLITVYDDVWGQGNNAYYRIPYFLAVEIGDMRLTGSMSSRYIRATIKGLHTANLVIEPGAPEHAALGGIRIAQ